MDTNPLRKRLKVFTLCLIASVKCSYDVFAFVSGTRVESRRPHPHPPDRLTRTAAGPHRTARKLVVSSRLVSSVHPTGHHRPRSKPTFSTSRGGDRDGAGGGGGRAVAGEVPAGGGDHDGRRGAAAGVHDLPQQALAVLLLRRLRRRALFLLQADVGVLALPLPPSLPAHLSTLSGRRPLASDLPRSRSLMTRGRALVAGTRGSSDFDLLLPQWRCDGRYSVSGWIDSVH